MRLRKEHEEWENFAHKQKFNTLDIIETCYDYLRDQKSLRRRDGREEKGGHSVLTVHAIIFFSLELQIF